MNINKIIYEEYNHAKYLKWKRDNVTLRGIKKLGYDNKVWGSFGKGLYTVPLSNKAMAKTYGNVYFVLNAKPQNPKVVQDRNVAEILMQTLVDNFCKKHGVERSTRYFEENTTIEDEMQKLGYDGLVIKGREMVNYTPPDDVKYFENESQLMNYYTNFVNELNEEEMDVKNKKIYVLVGPPSVGKSTWIKSLDTNNIIVINRDEIVEEVAEKNGLTYDEMFLTPSPETSEIGDVDPKYGEVVEAPPHMPWTKLVYSRLLKINGYIHYLLTTRIEQAVNSGKDIVVDMTNMNKGSRKRALKFLGDKSDEYMKIAVVFKFQGSEDIIKKVANIRAQQYKDAGKSKTIGDEVFDMMFKSYEEPTTEEGFDDIIYVDSIKHLERVIKNSKKF